MTFDPQPGDHVTIRTWDDMAQEFGLDEKGRIQTPNLTILKSMKPYCGYSYIVKSAYHELDTRTYLFYDNPFYFPLCALVNDSSSTSQPLPSSVSFDSLLQSFTSP